MDRAPGHGHQNSDAQGATIIPLKISSHLVLELSCTGRTRLLASYTEIRVKEGVAEGAAFLCGLDVFQALENVVPEPNRALIKTKSDVAAHRNPLELFPI